VYCRKTATTSQKLGQLSASKIGTTQYLEHWNILEKWLDAEVHCGKTATTSQNFCSASFPPQKSEQHNNHNCKASNQSACGRMGQHGVTSVQDSKPLLKSNTLNEVEGTEDQEIAF
jgi:hypothetical protein